MVNNIIEIRNDPKCRDTKESGDFKLSETRRDGTGYVEFTV